MSGWDKASGNLFREIPQTYLVQVFATVFGILFLKIASNVLTVSDFGALIVARRLVAFVAPVITLNLSISLARFPSIEPAESKRFFTGTFLISGFITIVVAISGIVFSDWFTLLLWQDQTFDRLWMPTILLTGATAFQLISVAYWRGIHDFRKMNAGIFLFRLAPLLMITFIAGAGVISIEIVEYCLMGTALLLILYHGVMHLYKSSFSTGVNWEHFRKFFTYGFNRFPSGLFYLAIFSFPVLFASSRYSLEIAGFVGILIAVVNLMAMTASPASLILLPKFALLGTANDRTIFQSKIRSFTEFIFQVPVLAGPVILLFSTEIIHYWVGPEYYAVIAGVKWISPGISGLMVFIFLRSIIDGIEEKPYVNIITIVGFMILVTSIVILSYVFNLDPVMVSAAGLSAGFCSLGALSVYYLQKSAGRKILQGTGLSSLIVLTLVFTVFYFGSTVSLVGVLVNLAVKLVLMTVVTGLILILVSQRNPDWLRLIKKELKR